MTHLLCACGCGTPLLRFSGAARVRPFLVGHKTRRPNPLIECACGCGGTLAQFDSRGRERRALPGHMSRLRPHQRIGLPCENCGTVVMRAPWHRNGHDHTFCSRPCHGAWAAQQGIRRGANNGHYNTITVPCAGCGAPISKAASLINRRNNRVYCPNCPPPKRSGAHGFYVGYPKEFSPALRTRIRKRDGHTCRWCNRPQSEVGTLHVHHIDYDKHNNDPSNLISLCRTCHGQTNWATPVWQERLSALLA